MSIQVLGEVTSDRPLLVLAVAEEAQFLETDLPVLLTGIGKVNAATTLSGVLAREPRPARVVNLGTAGALRPCVSGIQVVDRVIQHDFDTGLLRTLTGRTFGGPISIGERGGATLASGDSFVADGTARLRLAERAQLVDMEGYALAVAASRARVPIDIVKCVSDDADEQAVDSWPASVAVAARSLAEWAARNVPGYG